MWHVEQQLICGGCGLPRDETFSIENQGTYRAHKLQCHACAARDERVRDDHSTQGGLFWRVAQD